MKEGNDILWRIGCSGFHYKEWKDAFYPKEIPQKRWFEYYCEHFDTLELNVTFYRFPELSSLQSWHERSPAGFNFAVKAPRLITHYKKFKDTGGLISDFYGVAKEGLREKLGCILFQLPPDLPYSESTLENIIMQMDPAFKNVVEFRHNTWWNEKVIHALTNSSISFCSISYPGLPDTVICNTAIVYYRYHGVPRLYFSPYSKDFLQQSATDIRKNEHVREAYLYFNNTAELSAIKNAAYLQKLLLKKTSNSL
jgi:uncharacterized protein YecE (DUF72 family)